MKKFVYPKLFYYVHWESGSFWVQEEPFDYGDDIDSQHVVELSREEYVTAFRENALPYL